MHNTQIALNFIEKAVRKTKNKQLIWSIIDSVELKPLPEEEIKDYYQMYILNPNFSYCATYQSGLLCLLTHKINPYFNPPEGCSFSLRMQDDASRYSIEIATSGSDPTIATALIRLFNIIDHDTNSSSVMHLIQDFLDS